MKTGAINKNSFLEPLVAFTLDGQRYALPLASVERTLRTVEITPLPKAPDIVVGVINIRGRIVPVLNLRKRLALRDRVAELDSHLLVANTSVRCVAIVVDAVTGVVNGVVTPAASVIPGVGYLAGITKLPDGMLFIHDLDRFLSLEEEVHLTAAMNEVS